MQNEIELIQGQYWKATRAFPNELIKAGDVLLLQSIRDVDNTAHTGAAFKF